MDMLRKKLRGNVKAPTSQAKTGHAEASIVPSVEAFQNHWRQALTIIKRSADSSRPLTRDDVSTVTENVSKMADLLVDEEEENGQQGLCLVFLLAEDVLQQLVTWCLSSTVYENKIKYELLKILESMIAQSRQPLLYHKPVIRPLLTLLASCINTSLPEIENHVILLLHQLCVCISRNPQNNNPLAVDLYLELFFNVSYLSGQNNFLIFCLLIPYIHREGNLGQQARDALLLIMAASSRNAVIGKYIANNSDFCPVLATGLSGLYSSLPHKIRPEGHEDWYRIEKDLYLHMPDVQMIINCLEFCNAVVQVAHELVGRQLIDYIYNGFLLPVLAPALIQNSIEEQVSAIAYLELFVRTVSEPSLLRAFLHFILNAAHDDVIILEWLIDRISSSTKLCMVSLSLFKTLIELNCEDVMFVLCFRYLYRLTHVMHSQRRAIKQLDIYGHIAEKLLQLEPFCCRKVLDEEQQRQLISYNEGYPHSFRFALGSEFDLLSNLPFNFGFGNNRSGLLSIFSAGHSPTPTHLEDYKSSYLDYLIEAKAMIENCSKSCHTWCYVYDGELPPHNAALSSNSESKASIDSISKYDTPAPCVEDDVPLIELGDQELTSCPEIKRITDRPLIDFTSTEPPPKPTSTKSLSDDVPLCLGEVDQSPPLTHPVDAVADQHQTLQLLIQTQNEPIAGLVSPPAEPIVGVVSSTLQAPEERVVGCLDTASVDSFLSYLDSSVSNVSSDLSKSELELFSEVDSLIEQVETKAKQSAERQSSKDGAETITQFDKGETLASVPSQPVDVGSQETPYVDPRPKRQLNKCSFKIDENMDTTPSIGPFLSTLLSKLENMMHNSLSVNLLLTGLVTRIASYPQPLLRSFLLNQSFVFQPSIKSLIQVLASVRGKVDSYAEKVPNFNVLLLQARKIMMDRAEGVSVEGADGKQTSTGSSLIPDTDSSRSPGKRLTDFFRREKQTRSPSQPELVADSSGGYRFTNTKHADSKFESAESRLATMNTKKAVYCALVLEEFVKELAALSQQHAVHSDEGYQTD